MKSLEMWENINQLVEKASEWSQHENNQKLLGSENDRIQKKIRNSRLRIRKLEKAKSQNPTLGIYGPSQAGKSYLTSKLGQQSNGTLCINIFEKFDFLKDINPPGGRESTALVTRFSSKKQILDEDFPISAFLLSEADIVCILSNSYKKDLRESIYPSLEKIMDCLDNLKLNSRETEDPIEADSLLEIENYLDNYVFDKEISDRFSEVWKFLNKNHKYLDNQNRLKIFSLFWNNMINFSELFTSLVSERHKLGRSVKVKLEQSSLIPRDTSIIDVDVMKKSFLGDQDLGSIKLKTENDETFPIKRWAISALTEQLYLQLENPGLSIFDETDLLDFPGARSRIKTDISHSEKPEPSQIIELFLRGKIDFLFQKYVEEQSIDALALCIDPDPMEVADLPSSIINWINLNNGKDSKSRQETKNSLFFILTKFDYHLIDKPGGGNDYSVRFNNAIESALIQPFAKSKKSFVYDWDGGEFQNLFPLRNPSIKSEGIFEYNEEKEVGFVEKNKQRVENLKKGFLQSENIKSFIGQPSKKWESFIKPGDGGAEYLTQALESFHFKKNKDFKIKVQLSDVLNSMVESLEVYEIKENNEAKLKEEQTTFYKIWPEYQKICNRNRLSSLISIFSMTESLAKVAILNRPPDLLIDKQSDDPDSDSEVFIPDFIKDVNSNTTDEFIIEDNKMTRGQFYASSMVSAWAAKINDLSNNSKVLEKNEFSVELVNFISKHLSYPSNLKKLNDVIYKHITNSALSVANDSNLSAFSKIGCSAINSFTYYLSLDLDTDNRLSPVEYKEISYFTDANLEPFWKIWINGLGELIKNNISQIKDMDFDPIQNKVISNVLFGLNKNNEEIKVTNSEGL